MKGVLLFIAVMGFTLATQLLIFIFGLLQMRARHPLYAQCGMPAYQSAEDQFSCIMGGKVGIYTLP